MDGSPMKPQDGSSIIHPSLIIIYLDLGRAPNPTDLFYFIYKFKNGVLNLF